MSTSPRSWTSPQPRRNGDRNRSFGDNPDVVTRYAGAYARGLRDAGLLPVLKHFPGHGNASGDSHQTDVVTRHSGQLLPLTWCPTEA